MVDALEGNVDRTWRNVNMLRWHATPYLIDHGATLTFHHGWTGPEPPGTGAARPYDATAHVMLGAQLDGRAPDLDGADAALAPLVTPDLVRAVVALVPDRWLDVPGFAGPEQVRDAYAARLLARRDARDAWLPPLRDAVAQRPARIRAADGSVPPARQIWRRPT